MGFKTTHEIHERRFSRNVGVAVALLAFIAVMFGLTVAKVSNTGAVQGYDHVVRPELTETAK